jgi:hypothetical protein
MRPPVANDDTCDTTRNATLTIDADDGVLVNDDDDTPRDGLAISNPATVTITVDNATPAATDAAYASTGSGTLTVDASDGVLANDLDVDGDPLTATVVDDVTYGNLTLDAEVGFTYAPAAGNPGTDTFTYVANDGVADSNTATVTITVANGGHVATNDTYPMFRNGTLTIDAEDGILENDVDPDGDPIIAILITPPTTFTIDLADDDNFTYALPTGFTGPATVTIDVGVP